MGMAVDKAGHDHTACRVDLEGPACFLQILDTPRSPHLPQYAAPDQQCAIWDDMELVEFGPAARIFGTAKRN